MNSSIKLRCDIIIKNRDSINGTFLFENSLIKIVAGSLFAASGKAVDTDRLKECRKILHSVQGIFSSFRGNNEVIVITKMALSNDPAQYINNLSEVYKKLQKGKFFDSSYRALAAISICDQCELFHSDEIIEKTSALLEGMRKVHPFLTSDEDTCFAVLLAMTDKSVDTILFELEQTYQIIKKHISFHDNAVYSLSQIITAFDGNFEDKCEKIISLFNCFKSKGAKYGKEYELASIAALLDIDMDEEELVNEVIETADYLKSQKGFGMMSMNNHTRLMLGTIIVSELLTGSSKNAEASVLNGALSTIIAEETALMLSIMTVTTITAASSSN